MIFEVRTVRRVTARATASDRDSESGPCYRL